MVYHRSNQTTNWQRNCHTLILGITNTGREIARDCHANLTIAEITEQLESIPWRILQVAGGHGSSWLQVNVVPIPRSFTAPLWICYSFEGATEAYIETSRPEIQESAPYPLRFGQTYDVQVRVLGEELAMKVWHFTFRCIAWNNFEYTKPELAFVEGND
jgi:hypothetical protein